DVPFGVVDETGAGSLCPGGHGRGLVGAGQAEKAEHLLHAALGLALAAHLDVDDARADSLVQVDEALLDLAEHGPGLRPGWRPRGRGAKRRGDGRSKQVHDGLSFQVCSMTSGSSAARRRSCMSSRIAGSSILAPCRAMWKASRT